MSGISDEDLKDLKKRAASVRNVLCPTCGGVSAELRAIVREWEIAINMENKDAEVPSDPDL